MEKVKVMDIEDKIGDNEKFVVDNDLKAEWCIKHIREIEEEEQRILSTIQSEIDRYTELKNKHIQTYTDDKVFFIEQLKGYMATVKTKELKTQYAYQLPSAKLVQKKDKADFEVDKKKLAKYMEENNYTDYLKEVNEKTVDWASFKKVLEVNEDNEIINTETGEIIEDESLKVKIKYGSFEIK